MLFRLLIFTILGALIYRAVKSWLGTAESRGTENVTAHPPEQVDDVMIKDPVCGTYFPRRDAVILRLDDKDRLFCSTECRDRYVTHSSRH